MNRSLQSSINFKSPEEVCSSDSIDYSTLRIFGCSIYAHVNDGKLAPRVIKYMFLGYASESKGYHLWCLSSKKFIQSRDVLCNESAMCSPGKESTVSATSACNPHDTNDKVQLEVPT